MKIAFDVESALALQTGVGRFAREIIRGLAAIDRSHHYVLYHSSNYAAGSIHQLWDLPSNFEELTLSASRRSLRIWNLLGRLPFRVSRLLPDDLDLNYSPSHYLLPLNSRFAVGTVHDIGTIDRPQFTPFIPRVITRSDFRRMRRRANALVVVSEFTRGRVIDAWGIPGSRVRVVPNAFTSEFASYLNTDGQATDIPSEPYFIWIGAPSPRKNLDGLLAAFDRFTKDGQDDWKLVLAGPNTDTHAALANTVKKLGLSGRVELRGFVDDRKLANLVHRAAALIYPSFYEGFGIPILEAMAVGTPVIASDASAIPEIAGDAAILVNPNDRMAMAAAMKRIATDAATSRKLIAAGQERIKDYSWESSARKLLEVFESVTENLQSARLNDA